MSAEFRICSVEDSGWRPDRVAPDLNFQTQGQDLAVELRRWNKGQVLEVLDSGDLGEELGAVLEGRFELRCGEERYELSSGSGILVPQNEPRTWRVLSDDGVLYRVRKQ